MLGSQGIELGLIKVLMALGKKGLWNGPKEGGNLDELNHCKSASGLEHVRSPDLKGFYDTDNRYKRQEQIGAGIEKIAGNSMDHK